MKVLLHFTGLCALIPRKPIDKPNNEVTVALVDARQSHHEPHYCICFADPKTYPEELGRGVKNRPVGLAFNYADSELRSLRVNGCHLEREELTLVGRTEEGTQVTPMSDGGLTFAQGKLEDDCPNGKNQYYLDWVASMAGVGAGTVKDVVVNGNGGGLLGARLRLKAGWMRAHSFRMMKGKGPIRWKFGRVTSALAEEVAWEFAFKDDTKVVEVVLKSSRLGGGDLVPIVLRPMNDLVEAWIVNMPLGSLTGFDPIDPLKPSSHFEQIFRLAEGNHSAHIPTPDGTRYCEKPTGPSNPKCPPALFSPFSAQAA